MTIKHFHAGEIQLQTQAGVRKKMDVVAKHLMLDYMTDEHRDFYAGLEYFFLGTAAKDGRPTASLLVGPSGFVSSPDPNTLLITSQQFNEMSNLSNLAIGDCVGVLGIDLSNRRRNRMHGIIAAITANSVSITVKQSYGNCPKYINLRDISKRLDPGQSTKTVKRQFLTKEDSDLIASADTFFIASNVRDGTGEPYEGADINHRGGQAGFVNQSELNSLIIPDYTGNNLFNTLGNLVLNPQAALLFIDFETGDQLHLNGQTSLLEDSHTVEQFPGALRLIIVKIETIERRISVTPLRWSLIETSPYNPTLISKSS